MIRRFVLIVISIAGLGASATGIEIETVPVGNVDNAGDMPIASDGTTGHGVVPYNYRISVYEVTNTQYVEFLNAVGTSDTHALYHPKMGSNPRGGIIQNGTSGSFSYSVRPNMADKPVNWIEPRDAVRFANWLHNGQPAGSQDHSTTEDGAYTIDGALYTPRDLTRNEGARWFLPSDDEWYKAAYYDPRTEAQGGPPGDIHYWDYATQSNAHPILTTSNEIGEVSNPGPNVANFGNSVVWNTATGNVANVGGAGPESVSFYETYDQTGNVWEWTDTVVRAEEVPRIAVRGGCYDDHSFIVRTNRRPAGRDSVNDTYSGTHGLRLATVFLPDDLDGNGRVEATDIDLLSDKVNSRTLNTAFDLNANGVVDEDDRRVWVEDVVGTYFGDANLDGRFGSGDLVQVLEAGHYEDGIPFNSSWSVGDWDGNREFESKDFVFVLQRGGYEEGVRVAVAAVPEPSGVALLAVGLAILAWWRRKTF